MFCNNSIAVYNIVVAFKCLQKRIINYFISRLVCKFNWKIVERAADFGIPREDVLVDPLIMPVGAINMAGRTALDLISRLRTELKVNTTCGASNISFGLPNRHGMNAAFLSMAAGAGMTSAIMNPLHSEEMTAIMGANVMNGVDPECRKWISKFREAPAEGSGQRERRQTRRRARA